MSELDFYVVADGGVTRGRGVGELMESIHQTWGLDRAVNRWRVDVFREPSDDDELGRAAATSRSVSRIPS